MTETEELLFICQHDKTCNEDCVHKGPHKYINDLPGGCPDPMCGPMRAKCKPHNINEKTKKQFAKFVVEKRIKC